MGDMMEIKFVTDFVCPYCIVAKEALNQALAETGLEAQVKILPYELTEEPASQVDTFHDMERRERYKQLDESVKTLGMDVKLPPTVVPRPYTRLAFEGWHYAEEKGAGNQYADQVYKAYFTDEKDIGQISVLAGLAAEIGLDEEDFRQALETGRYHQAEKDAVVYAKQQLGIRHVPVIFVDGEEIGFQTYDKDSWTAFFNGRKVENGEEPGFGCGDDGCGIAP